jgi:hypothetical protein
LKKQITNFFSFIAKILFVTFALQLAICSAILQITKSSSNKAWNSVKILNISKPKENGTSTGWTKDISIPHPTNVSLIPLLSLPQCNRHITYGALP